jgi:hypothetical protein
MWDFEYDLVEEFYDHCSERWQVDLGDEFLEVFVRTAKIEIPEGGESSSSTKSTCHTTRGWLWLWWARSRGAKADHERFEVDQGGQGIDEVDWWEINVVGDVEKLKPHEAVGR